MKNKSAIFLTLAWIAGLFYTAEANADIRLKFQRVGTDTQSTKILVTDENGKSIEGASATMQCSHPFVATKKDVTNDVICPNVNGKDNPNITMSFNIKGLSANQLIKSLGLDIHAFMYTGKYQGTTGDAERQYNIKATVTGTDQADFGVLSNIDIAKGVSTGNKTHKMWTINHEKGVNIENETTINLTITSGEINKGCYIGFSEIVLSEKEGEITPDIPTPEPDMLAITSSPAIGKSNVCYAINNLEGKALKMQADHQLSWADPDGSVEQAWYFVENKGSYILVNLNNDEVYSIGNETNTLWTIVPSNDEKGFSLIPTASKEDAKTALSIEGKSTFRFNVVHNGFARRAQVYHIPCGTLGSNYITQIHLTGDVLKTMHYPVTTVVNGELTVPTVGSPATEYIVYTRDHASAAAGNTFEMTIQLNQAPVAGLEGFLHFDWNCDGVFESVQPFKVEQTSVVKVTVPNTVKEGRTRVRIRLTDNGLKAADDDVVGQVFDFNLNLQEATPESYCLNVVSNDEHRGTVTANVTSGWNVPCEVTATPMGNATFVCWKEGHQVVSVDKTYKFTLDHNTALVACFSPNTESATGIEKNLAEKNQIIDISTDHKYITVDTDTEVIKILVFAPSGKLVAQTKGKSMNLAGVSAGSYIVKVYTKTNDETAKILLK